MKRTSEQTAAWIVDYSAARQEAIRWLGERYILARPINAKRELRRIIPAAIVQSTPPEMPDSGVARTDH